MPNVRKIKPVSDVAVEPHDAGGDEMALVVEGLTTVTRSLAAANAQLAQLARTLGPRVAGEPDSIVRLAPAPAAASVNTWESDPFSEATPTLNPALAPSIAVNAPVNANPALRTTIAEPQPPSGRYQPGTLGFRYWTAAEALARGINFWSALLPSGTTWSTANPMRISLVEPGQNLNANYSRANGLRFYHSVVGAFDVHSCESPAVVNHELGHAVLDALRPQLFNAASDEVGAFHESFGDMSAILTALQSPSFRAKVLAETDGRIHVNSRLSRVAEQLGWAIRQSSPRLVDVDALRNASNRFFYRRPALLPPMANANVLSSAAHSFSRVFTGAFLDALANMLTTTGAATEDNLLKVSRDMGQILVDAIHTAPITNAYFGQVAAAMVQAQQARHGGRYRTALNSAFVRRGILSVTSSMALADAPIPEAKPIAAVKGMAGADFGAQDMLQYGAAAPDEAFRLGLCETPDLPLRATRLGPLDIQVHAPDDTPMFEVAPATFGMQPADDPGADTLTFLEGLIQRGQIDTSARGTGELLAMRELVPEQRHTDSVDITHSLVAQSGGIVLKRNHFACGFCQQARGRRCH